MERLTAYSKQTSHKNGICCTHFCGPECLGVGGNCAMNCKWEEAAWSRLAAYEDSELEAEEVFALIKDWIRLCATIRACGGIDRLRELSEADKDGRVVGHGVWIPSESDFDDDDTLFDVEEWCDWQCSACREDICYDDPMPMRLLPKYCPNCGAKMDGGDSDEGD